MLSSHYSGSPTSSSSIPVHMYPSCSVLAGSSQVGLQNGAVHSAKFHEPYSVVVDGSNNIYIADRGNHCIRKVTSEGTVLTVAGSGQTGFADGLSSFARFNYPEDIALDSGGNLIVADSGNHAIRRISPNGYVSTIAGQGRPGDADGRVGDALFKYPRGVALDLHGNIYVADFGNQKLKKICTRGDGADTAGGEGQEGPTGLHVTTVAITGLDALQLSELTRLAMDPSGQIFMALGTRVLLLDSSGRASVYVGCGARGDADGTRREAMLSDVAALTLAPDGSLLLADRGSRKIKRVSVQGVVSTLSSGFQNPCGLVVDRQGRLVVCDISTSRLWGLSTSFQASPFNHQALAPPLSPAASPCPLGTMLLSDTSHADITFEVGGHRLTAHRAILAARSEYFQSMFSAGLSESQTGVVKLTDETIDHAAFEAVLQYLYTGVLTVTDENVLEVMALCHQYLLDDAVKACLTYALTNIKVVNVVRWFVWAADKSIDQLRKATMRFLLMNLEHMKVAASEQLQPLQQRPELLMELMLHLVP